MDAARESEIQSLRHEGNYALAAYLSRGEPADAFGAEAGHPALDYLRALDALEASRDAFLYHQDFAAAEARLNEALLLAPRLPATLAHKRELETLKPAMRAVETIDPDQSDWEKIGNAADLLLERFPTSGRLLAIRAAAENIAALDNILAGLEALNRRAKEVGEPPEPLLRELRARMDARPAPDEYNATRLARSEILRAAVLERTAGRTLDSINAEADEGLFGEALERLAGYAEALEETGFERPEAFEGLEDDIQSRAGEYSAAARQFEIELEERRYPKAQRALNQMTALAPAREEHGAMQEDLSRRMERADRLRARFEEWREARNHKEILKALKSKGGQYLPREECLEWHERARAGLRRQRWIDSILTALLLFALGGAAAVWWFYEDLRPRVQPWIEYFSSGAEAGGGEAMLLSPVPAARIEGKAAEFAWRAAPGASHVLTVTHLDQNSVVFSRNMGAATQASLVLPSAGEYEWHVRYETPDGGVHPLGPPRRFTLAAPAAPESEEPPLWEVLQAALDTAQVIPEEIAPGGLASIVANIPEAWEDRLTLEARLLPGQNWKPAAMGVILFENVSDAYGETRTFEVRMTEEVSGISRERTLTARIVDPPAPEPTVAIPGAPAEGTPAPAKRLERASEWLAAGEYARAKAALMEDPELADAADAEGATLLHRAVETGEYRAAQMVLPYMKDINARDARGQTPLHRAAAGGWLEIAQLLMIKGADPGVRDGENLTPSQTAIQNGHYRIGHLLTQSLWRNE